MDFGIKQSFAAGCVSQPGLGNEKPLDYRKPETENRKPQTGKAEEGVVLLLVLWVLALLSALILSWAQEWRTELKLAENFRQGHQSRRLAEGGVYYALGKLMAYKLAEAPARGQGGASPLGTAPLPSGWQPDQSLHVLELSDSRVEIRIADEGGKINLNRADEEILRRFFAVLGYRDQQIPALVDAILDWRDRDSLLRPQGAESDYYRSLDPPYAAKNGRFEVVEELAWVRGFMGSAILPRLCQWLTVQSSGVQINLNTAPQEVLQTLGFSAEQAGALIQARQLASLKQSGELPGMLANAPEIQANLARIGFQSAPFFTIISTGMINNGGGSHTIKALVRLDINSSSPWQILNWDDDYPLK
jgi:general secretion pathway protein K